MKTIKSLIILSIASVMLLSSCVMGSYKAGDRVEGTTTAHVDSVSYAVGVFFANSLASADFGEVKYDMVVKGLKDKLNEDSLKIVEEEIMPFLRDHLSNRAEKVAEANLVEGQEFLAKKEAEGGVVKTESGLLYEVVAEGSGISPTLADEVEVNYRGTLVDGTEFDASPEGKPVKFPLNRVIKGWQEGITYAKEGGQIKLYVPADLAYGPQGAPGRIPGNATLIFEVELVKVYKATAEKE